MCVSVMCVLVMCVLVMCVLVMAGHLTGSMAFGIPPRPCAGSPGLLRDGLSGPEDSRCMVSRPDLSMA